VFWVFVGLVLVVPVYLGAPYAFFNKVLLTYQKKKKKLKLRMAIDVLWPVDKQCKEMQPYWG